MMLKISSLVIVIIVNCLSGSYGTAVKDVEKGGSFGRSQAWVWAYIGRFPDTIMKWALD